MVIQKQNITISINEFVTVLQAAKSMGVHFTTIYRWIEAGTILSIKFGGITFVPKSEVERLKNKKATA